MVPYIPMHEHMHKRRYYEAIGRILSHTVALLHYAPARLSRCTLLCLALDSSHITHELLLSDMRYDALPYHFLYVLVVCGGHIEVIIHYSSSLGIESKCSRHDGSS